MHVHHRGVTIRKIRLRVERIKSKIYEHITAILCILAFHRKNSQKIGFTCKGNICLHMKKMVIYTCSGNDSPR